MKETENNILKLNKAQLLKNSPVLFEKAVYSFAESSHLYAHDIVEICIVESGVGIHKILNHEIPCKKDELYIINSDVPHSFYAQNKNESITVRKIFFDPRDWFEDKVSITGNPEFCHGVFMENSVSVYAALNTETHKEIDLFCRAISNELSQKEPQWKNSVKANLSLLLITLSRYINGTIKNKESTALREKNIISSIINVINDCYGDFSLTLEALSSRFYMSSTRLSRLFKENTGISFSEYLRSVRLAGACKLLSESEKTVEEIVALCGLKDIPTFYKVFNAHTGMTPNAYRNFQKSKQTEKYKGEKFMVLLSEISVLLQAGKAKQLKEMVQQAIDEGISAERILNEGLLPGMNEVGEKFKNNKIFVPEVLIAARAMNQGTELLKPLLIKEGIPAAGKVCIGTVHGDLHDIGKNIVKLMLEAKGFEVIDLGTDVPAQTFVNTAIENNCDLICCSALLTTTISVMEDVVRAVDEAGIHDKVKVLIGGAPVTEEFCKKIGADAYTPDAASCADVAYNICKNKKNGEL